MCKKFIATTLDSSRAQQGPDDTMKSSSLRILKYKAMNFSEYIFLARTRFEFFFHKIHQFPSIFREKSNKRFFHPSLFTARMREAALLLLLLLQSFIKSTFLSFFAQNLKNLASVRKLLIF